MTVVHHWQAVEALRALKIKVDKRYDDDMRTLQYYLSELQAAGEKLHAEYKCEYAWGNIS